MGFGFNLFFVFILIPLTGILLVSWLVTKKRINGKLLLLLWASVSVLVFGSGVIRWWTAKIELDKNDYYGEYVIDRDYFPGVQADWQYEHFRFVIKENDSLYFYVTDKERVIKTYRGSIKTVKPYNSERLVVHMQQPTHHIMAGNPTTYRSNRDFYLVFRSPTFNNVYFKKGKWKPIRDK